MVKYWPLAMVLPKLASFNPLNDSVNARIFQRKRLRSRQGHSPAHSHPARKGWSSSLNPIPWVQGQGSWWLHFTAIYCGEWNNQRTRVHEREGDTVNYTRTLHHKPTTFISNYLWLNYLTFSILGEKHSNIVSFIWLCPVIFLCMNLQIPLLISQIWGQGEDGGE